MIQLSRLNGKHFILNCEMIRTVEETPDTMITLTTGEKLLVKESVDYVIQSTIRYRQTCFQAPPFTKNESKGDV